MRASSPDRAVVRAQRGGSDGASTVRGGEMSFNPRSSLAAPGRHSERYSVPPSMRVFVYVLVCMWHMCICMGECVPACSCARTCVCISVCACTCLHIISGYPPGTKLPCLHFTVGDTEEQRGTAVGLKCFASQRWQNRTFKLRQADSAALLLKLRNCLLGVPLPTTRYCPKSFGAEDRQSKRPGILSCI